MSSTRDTQFLQSVQAIISDGLESDYAKAKRIAQLASETYTREIEPLKQAAVEGNHCVNLAPERIYRLAHYVDDGHQVTHAKVTGVVFTNGQHWVPPEDMVILLGDDFLKKQEVEVELPGVHGVIRVNGSQRGNAAVNLRYTPHDPNMRVGVDQYQLRLFYVKSPAISLSNL